MIPKKLHFVWVGDESKRPDNLIKTWIDLHKDWEIKIWGNEEYNNFNWINKKYMSILYDKYLCGVADLMRYEILYNEGGVAVDADSVCINMLDDNLLIPPVFSAWENEIIRPGLLANGTMGAEPNNSFVKKLISEIDPRRVSAHIHPWISVGPLHLTNCFRRQMYSEMEIYPSYYFTPRHFTGLEYKGNMKTYAKQFWASTPSNINNTSK